MCQEWTNAKGIHPFLQNVFFNKINRRFCD